MDSNGARDLDQVSGCSDTAPVPCPSNAQAVFLTYGAMAPGSAELAAELLGFDPTLVLPQLEKTAASGAAKQEATIPSA